MTDRNTPPPLAAGQIEIWKKIVDVQQHFNDLELRIRNFALIVTGAFLGLGGYAIKDGGIIKIFGLEVSLAGLVVGSAIFPLLAFYFMDRLWYHRLLDGSVKAGIEAETALQELGYKVELGSKISAASPFRLWLLGKSIHSKTKMDIFYGMLVVALLAVGCGLGFGSRLHATPPKIEQIPAANEKGALDTAHQFAPSTGIEIAPSDAAANGADELAGAPDKGHDSKDQ